MAEKFSLLFNIIWFQACWFACVLIGNKAAIVILTIVLLTYWLVERLRIEWPLILSIALLGLVVDISLIQVGVLSADSTLSWPPLWLSVLWLAFATTINHSLRPLLKKRLLFLLLATAGGPLCYKLGVQLTEIEFGYGQSVSLIVIAVAWLLSGLVIIKLYERWKHYAFT